MTDDEGEQGEQDEDEVLEESDSDWGSDQGMRVSIPLDLHPQSFIPLSRFLRCYLHLPLLDPSLVFCETTVCFFSKELDIRNTFVLKR